MLDIKEKLALQKTIKSGLDKIRAGISDIRERLAVQREIKDALDILAGKKSKDSLLDQLLAGKFLKTPAVKFLSVVKAVMEEINNDVKQIQEPILAYFREHWNENDHQWIFESAELDVSIHSRPLSTD